MLVPGEFLTVPVQPPTSPAVGETATATKTLTTVAPTLVTEKAEKAEPRSFLLILMRALGAVHT